MTIIGASVVYTDTIPVVIRWRIIGGVRVSELTRIFGSSAFGIDRYIQNTGRARVATVYSATCPFILSRRIICSDGGFFRCTNMRGGEAARAILRKSPYAKDSGTPTGF